MTTHTDLAAQAKSCGATVYTHRTSPHQAAIAFSPPAWEKFAAALESQPDAAQGAPDGMALVPVEFLRGFRTLAHNYSLKAEPPDYYRGTEGDAFSNAYRRCGHDLAELDKLLTATPQPAASSRGDGGGG